MKKAAADTTAMGKSAQGSFAELNKKVGELGSELTRKVTVPLAATGAGALKLASDFETAFAQMVGLAGVAGDEVAGLRDEVLKLSHETAVGPQKLAEALYFVRSSGIDAANAMSVLEASAKASAAGMGEPAVIARTLSAAINAYGAANLSAAEATDVLVAGIRAASFEPDQLAASLGTVIATASTMGITFDNLIGTLAVLSRTGLDASEATVSLNAVLAMLQNGGAAATTLLESHGISLQQLRDIAAGPGGVIEAMRLLDRTFGDDQEALATIIPNVRAFRGAMTLLAQDGKIVDQVMADVGNSAGSLQGAFDAVKGTDAFKIKQGWSDLQATLIQLGAVLAPLAGQFAEFIGGVVRGFASLPGPVKEVIVVLAVLAAAVGPLMKVFSAIVGPIRAAIAAVQTFQLQMALARAQGLSTTDALAQMASGFTGIKVAAAAATLLLVGLTMAIRDNEERARMNAERQKALADAIKETGTVAGGVAGLINALLTGSQDFAAGFAHAGVTVGDVSAALVAGGDAWDAMVKRILDGARAAGIGGLQLEGLASVLNGLPNDAARAQQYLANLAVTGASTGTAAESLGSALSGTAAVLSDSVKATAEQARAWDIANMSAAGLEQGVTNLLSTMSALFGATFDAGNAQQGFADSVDDVGSSMRTGGGSTRDLEKDQRNLEKATKDVTAAQKGLAEAEAALVEARKGPTTREKSDAALDVREATLAVKEATKAQADARKQLLEERKKGKAGDVVGAQLNVEGAAIRLKRAQDRLTDAQKAQNDVLHSGEEASKDVKSALDDLEKAQQAVADATERQIDAEKTLRGEGASGGPVADRARTLRGVYDNLTTSGQSWITKLIEMGKPTSEVQAALETQRVAVQKLIDTYGDPDGKLRKYLDYLYLIRLELDKMDMNNPAAWGQGGADYGIVSVTINRPARAMGGPVDRGVAYLVGEKGPELFTPGQSGYITPNDKLGKLDSVGLSAQAMMSAPPQPWNGPLQSAAVGAVSTMVDNRTIEVTVELDSVRVANSLVRLSKHSGGLPIRIRASN